MNPCYSNSQSSEQGNVRTTWLVDDLPEFYQSTDDYTQYVIQIPFGCETQESIAHRSQRAKAAWENNPSRHKQAADWMIEMRKTSIPPQNLSEEHKQNIAYSMIGNQNKTGKRGGNQYTVKVTE